MTRKTQLGPKAVLSEANRSTDINGEQSVCEFVDRVIYDITWVNGSSLNATVVIQKSHDGINWYPLDLVTTLTLSGTSGSHTAIIDQITYKYIRPIVTFSAGSGDILIIIKGVSEGN